MVSQNAFVLVKKTDYLNMSLVVYVNQRVTVLHLEEKCERAIDLAMKLEPSIKHMVRDSNMKK